MDQATNKSSKDFDARQAHDAGMQLLRSAASGMEATLRDEVSKFEPEDNFLFYVRFLLIAAPGHEVLREAVTRLKDSLKDSKALTAAELAKQTGLAASQYLRFLFNTFESTTDATLTLADRELWPRAVFIAGYAKFSIGIRNAYIKAKDDGKSMNDAKLKETVDSNREKRRFFEEELQEFLGTNLVLETTISSALSMPELEGSRMKAIKKRFNADMSVLEKVKVLDEEWEKGVRGDT